MSDQINTKLGVQSDEWEAGFAAARKSLKHFEDDTASTAEKVREKLEGLKQNFGRRGLLGEGLETLMGGGAIAGLTVGITEVVEKSKELYEAVTHEEQRREANKTAVEMQNKAMEQTLSVQKEISEEARRTAQFLEQADHRIAASNTASIADPIERERATTELDFKAKHRDAIAEGGSELDEAQFKHDEESRKINADADKEQALLPKNLLGNRDHEAMAAIDNARAAAQARNDEDEKHRIDGINKSMDEKISKIEEERQAAIASIAAKAQAQVTYNTETSSQRREFSSGGEAGMLREDGMDESGVNAAFELRKQQSQGLITADQASAAISEQIAASRQRNEQAVQNALTETRQSQDALNQTMGRGAIVGGEVNKVLDALAHHKISPESADALLDQAKAADEAKQKIEELAKGYNALRNISKESADIQSLLNRGVDMKWVTQLAGIGGAAMDAKQLNAAVADLEKQEALTHLVQRSAQAESGLRSLTEKTDDLQKLMNQGVDARFVEQIAGMGGGGKETSAIEAELKKQQELMNVLNAKKHIEEETIALAAKRANMTTEEYKLRQQGDSQDAAALHDLERQGQQLDANRHLIEQTIALRNRDSDKAVRNRYSAIRPGMSEGFAGVDADSDPFRTSAQGKRSITDFASAPGYITTAKEVKSAGADGNAGAVDPITGSYIRDIRNGVLDNLPGVANF